MSPSEVKILLELRRSLLSPPPGYTLRDEMTRRQGFARVPTWTLYQTILGTQLASLGPGFRVPVVFFQGTEDRVTPLALTEEYFRSVNAPAKELVRFEGAGHFAVWSHAPAFGQELVRRVRPLALAHPTSL